MTEDPIRIDFALICDDLRREDNGKLILIGVYPYDIGVSEFPANVVVTVVLGLEVTGPVEKEFEIRVKHDGNQITAGRGKFGIEASAIIGFGGTFLKQIPRPGVVEFQLKFQNGDWQTIKKIPIVLANASPPPS